MFLGNQYADKRNKQWSFQVSLPIIRSNARKRFFPARVQLVMSQFRLSGRGRNRGAGHPEGTSDTVRGPRHRPDRTGHRHPGREPTLDSGAGAGWDQSGHREAKCCLEAFSSGTDIAKQTSSPECAIATRMRSLLRYAALLAIASPCVCLLLRRSKACGVGVPLERH